MDRHLVEEARRVARMTGSRLRLRIPSILGTGELFSLRLSITGPDCLPDDNFPHALLFEGSVGVEGLPPRFCFEPGKSTAEIQGLRAVGPDVALIRCRVVGTGKIDGDPYVLSNPAWVFDSPACRLFWGDIHVHTRYSNCSAWRCLDPEWCYLYARDITLLDFAAAADHLRGIAAEPHRWPRLQRLARVFNEPGRFATFLAFESSHAHGYGGDNNVYFLDDDAPHFWLDREDMTAISPKIHLRELWRQLDASGTPYLTIPHHTGRSGKFRTWDDDCYEQEKEPLFEIYSSWGSSETRWSRIPISGGNNDAPSYFVDALKAGARFGAIASSDDHATLPGEVHQHRIAPFRLPSLVSAPHQGLAAIRAPELSRESLFAAMRRRQTYATTLAMSLVEMRIGDALMGEEIPLDEPLRRSREVRVRFTLHDAFSARVTLVRNGEEYATQTVAGRELSEGINEITFVDSEPFARIALKNARFHPEPFVVYYVRIEDNHGFHQWTSPIWIDGK